MSLIVWRGQVMGRDCGRGNDRLDKKALAVNHVTEREEGGSKIPLDLPACVSLLKCSEYKKTDLSIRRHCTRKLIT